MQHTGDGRQAESTACTCLQHLDNRRSGTIVPESGNGFSCVVVTRQSHTIHKREWPVQGVARGWHTRLAA